RYDSFDQFLQRTAPESSSINAERREEQDLSGICSQFCMDAMMEDPEESEKAAGKEVRKSGPWVMRRTTAEEEAEAGVKVVWEEAAG
ncbi:MAG: hypothetical protein Q9183_005715, partial [Haloplaca sp. 2 TL-2023]